ncbi:MAG: hypothetical protein D6790_02925, partial [Caldilineae bacterium]
MAHSQLQRPPRPRTRRFRPPTHLFPPRPRPCRPPTRQRRPLPPRMRAWRSSWATWWTTPSPATNG